MKKKERNERKRRKKKKKNNNTETFLEPIEQTWSKIFISKSAERGKSNKLSTLVSCHQGSSLRFSSAFLQTKKNSSSEEGGAEGWSRIGQSSCD